MNFTDYLKLGFAGIKAHKKRALSVVIIVGILFGIIIAGTFILQGIENVVLGEMLESTNGNVLIISNVDPKICDESCDLVAEIKHIKGNIAKYGGRVLDAKTLTTADGAFYSLDGNVFGSDGEAAGVIVPLVVAANLANTSLPNTETGIIEKVEAIKEAREKTLGRTVESRTGEKYFVAGILPSEVYINNLSFTHIGQNGNPLELVFGQLKTGNSQNFTTESISGGNVGEEETTLVFTEFTDIKVAYNYYKDAANYCSEIDRVFSSCSKDYKYQVAAAISDPLTAYENLQNVWSVFRIAAVVLTAIALIIALSTYLRLIYKDAKIISLYRAMGATDFQIRLVYAVYLMILSIMAIVFAIGVGLASAALLSIVNMTALQQVFALGLGAVKENIWLIGWNNLVFVIMGAMLLGTILAILLGNGNFRAEKLIKRMK